MRTMERWLGDGGMPLLGVLGATFARYGIDDAGVAWAEADWCPTDLACNPHGTVQGGVYTVLLDAVMNFAVNTGLDGRDRSRATLEMKTEMMRPALVLAPLVVRGEVVRMARQVAFVEGRVRNAENNLVSRATGTWMLHRE